jgi:predicted DNA-binding transcriptional regulator AlpA
MKKPKYSVQFLEELKKVPIVQVACEKTGVSRNTVYRWKRNDKKFAAAFDEALSDGVNYVNDMSESQLLQLIKEKNFPAVRFWLNKRHPAYKEKVEVINRHELPELTDSQKETIKQALKLSNINKHSHE